MRVPDSPHDRWLPWYESIDDGFVINVLATMPSRYAQWMYDWETRLTSVDNNRVVRPLDWGLDWTQSWPSPNGGPSRQASGLDLLEYFSRFNARIIKASDELYSYHKPADLPLERPGVP